MDRSAREDIRSVLAGFGIDVARRATPADPTEEVILLGQADFERVNPTEVTLAVMAVLPNVKVWVVQDGPSWQTEVL